MTADNLRYKGSTAATGCIAAIVAVQCLTDLDALRRIASESRDSRLREKAAAILKANEPKKNELPNSHSSHRD